jgi:hypothetical protein
MKLTCNHVLLSSTLVLGSETMCPKCWRIQEVVGIVTPYGWSCETCGVRRTYNSRRLACESAAMKHFRSNRTHKVTASTLDGKILWESHPISHEQLELALHNDQIPF